MDVQKALGSLRWHYIQGEMNDSSTVRKPTLRKERENIIKNLFGSTKESCWIESSFFCDHGYNISVGENFFAATNCVMLDCGEIIIGDNVLVGPNVGLYTVNHAFNSKERAEG